MGGTSPYQQGESRVSHSPYLWGLWLNNPQTCCTFILGPICELFPLWSFCKILLLAKCPSIKDNCGELASKFISENGFGYGNKGVVYFHTILQCRKKALPVPIHRKNCAQSLTNTLLKICVESYCQGGLRWHHKWSAARIDTIQKAIFQMPCIWLLRHQNTKFLVVGLLNCQLKYYCIILWTTADINWMFHPGAY